jgi:hypothetical protein
MHCESRHWARLRWDTWVVRWATSYVMPGWPMLLCSCAGSHDWLAAEKDPAGTGPQAAFPCRSESSQTTRRPQITHLNWIVNCRRPVTRHDFPSGSLARCPAGCSSAGCWQAYSALQLRHDFGPRVLRIRDQRCCRRPGRKPRLAWPDDQACRRGKGWHALPARSGLDCRSGGIRFQGRCLLATKHRGR